MMEGWKEEADLAALLKEILTELKQIVMPIKEAQKKVYCLFSFWLKQPIQVLIL
jgi:hypothetical protein